MIERASEFGTTQTPPLIPGDSTNKTAGDLLREAREAHNLPIDVVAAALKVSPQKLQALENDDIGALPDPVFARALAASVCRALHVDPAPVLAKLPGAVRPGLAEADRSISSSFRSSAPRSRSRAIGGLPSRAVLIVVGLLLAGAAALFWLPSGAFERLGQWVSGFTAGQRAPSTEAGPGGTVLEAPVAPVAAVEPTAPVAPPVAEPAPPVAATPAPAPVGNDVLVFVVREDSWITVNDAGGKPVLRRTVRAGETVGVGGTLPLSVVVGRAGGVEVQVRGKPFDLTPLARSGGVARFEVKP
ncbi:helix-turn-helix domain-containing protein [Variovorax boronicumulans]|uniref:helix-turn-helix domain-containing protein n=1 Tax=Variovorax boronicumulans TaxID=436515 RepID=UPI001C5617B7